jgi:hypothetical protein
MTDASQQQNQQKTQKRKCTKIRSSIARNDYRFPRAKPVTRGGKFDPDIQVDA